MFKKVFCLLAVLVIASSANAALIAYYNFGSGTASSANQGTAGTAADGVLVNGATIVDIDTSARGVEWALQLNNYTSTALADTQHMNITNGDDTWYDTAIPLTLGARSYAAWVRLNPNDKNWQTIMSKGYETTMHMAAGTPQGVGDDQIVFATHKGIASWAPLNGTVGVKSDTYWVHVIGTVDGADYKTGSLYINGVLQESLQSWQPMYQNDLDLLVGAEPNKTAWAFGWDGMIDDVRIYDEHISQTDATDLFVNTYNAARPTIPEPTTIALLGLGGLALLRRKR